MIDPVTLAIGAAVVLAAFVLQHVTLRAHLRRAFGAYADELATLARGQTRQDQQLQALQLDERPRTIFAQLATLSRRVSVIGADYDDLAARIGSSLGAALGRLDALDGNRWEDALLPPDPAGPVVDQLLQLRRRVDQLERADAAELGALDDDGPGPLPHLSTPGDTAPMHCPLCRRTTAHTVAGHHRSTWYRCSACGTEMTEGMRAELDRGHELIPTYTLPLIPPDTNGPVTVTLPEPITGPARLLLPILPPGQNAVDLPAGVTVTHAHATTWPGSASYLLPPGVDPDTAAALETAPDQSGSLEVGDPGALGAYLDDRNGPRHASPPLESVTARVLADPDTPAWLRAFLVGAAEQCPADWGSATDGQRCTRADHHEGPHRDRTGFEWPAVVGEAS